MPRSPFLVHAVHAHAHLAVQQQVAAPALAEGRAQVEADDYRELQPLGLVHAHYAHHVVALAQSGRRGHVLTGAPELLHILQKAVQAAVLRVLILGRALAQQAQVGLPLQPSGQRAHVHIVARLVQQQPCKLAQRQRARVALPCVQAAQEVAHARAQRGLGALAALRVALQRLGKAALGRGGAHRAQVGRVKAEHGRVHHAQQVKVAQAVVYHAHQLQQLPDLKRIEVAAGGIGIGGYALAQQHLQRLGRQRLHRAGEHHYVARLHRAQLARLAVQHGRADKLLYQLRGHARLALLAGELLQLVLFLGVLPLPGFGLLVAQYVQFNRRVVLQRGQARPQRGAVVVVYLILLAVHHAREHAVYEVQHIGARAEVAVEVYAQRVRALAARKAVVLGHEYGRVGLAEAVDALLDVAHHEARAGRRDQVQYALLHQRYVLIFVDEHIVEHRPHRARHGRVAQRPERVMLQVVEVERAALALAARVLALEQALQARQRRYRAAEVGVPGRVALRQQQRQLLHGRRHVLGALAHELDELGQRRA